MSNTISNKALKLKLNPNSSQYSQFIKFFGCERFVYNFYLNEKNQFYEKEIKPLGNDKKARNAVWKTFEETSLADLKKQYSFLKEADSQGIANAYMNLRAAYQKFYSGLTKLPKFHSRKSKNSYKNSMMKQNCLNWNKHYNAIKLTEGSPVDKDTLENSVSSIKVIAHNNIVCFSDLSKDF